MRQNAVLCGNGLSFLPNDNISDWSKLKRLADEKINGNKKVENCSGKNRNHCGGKGENAGDSIFSLSHNVFKSFFFFVLGSLKLGIVQ